MPEPITIAVEGVTDAAVVKRLLREAGLAVGPEYVANGKHQLDDRLRGYDSAARHSCWLVVRDLDEDAGCAPALRRSLLASPAPHMRLHVAVHAIEAWLLADRTSIARFLGVPSGSVPADPEAILRPKLALVELARRSRRSGVRGAMVPAPTSRAVVGRGYAGSVIAFAGRQWRPRVAAESSPSLARLRAFLHGVGNPKPGA